MRDLVDIIVIARTQHLTLPALQTAIASERTKRGLDARPTFDPPAEWATTFPKQASATPRCADLDFTAAVELARRLLHPALGEQPVDLSWDPAGQAWHDNTHR